MSTLPPLTWPSNVASTNIDLQDNQNSKIDGSQASPPQTIPTRITDVDTYEQLYNQRQCGPITTVSLPEVRITDLHGIMLDLDQRLLTQSQLIPNLPTDPVQFYDQIAKFWLARHDVLRRAEVRCSGRGLHVILRPDSPVLFNTVGDRQRWKGIIDVIRCCLPTDPNASSLTALTRPIGSINFKSNSPVTRLAEGEPIAVADLEAFAQQMRTQPFETVLQILTGRTRIQPCLVCKTEGSRLSAVGNIGNCYAKCGTVSLTTFLNTVYAHAESPKDGSKNHVKA